MSESNVREEWSNCIGNQHVSPLHILRPTTLAEIIEIIMRAERENMKK